MKVDTWIKPFWKKMWPTKYRLNACVEFFRFSSILLTQAKWTLHSSKFWRITNFVCTIFKNSMPTLRLRLQGLSIIVFKNSIAIKLPSLNHCRKFKFALLTPGFIVVWLHFNAFGYNCYSTWFKKNSGFKVFFFVLIYSQNFCYKNRIKIRGIFKKKLIQMILKSHMFYSLHGRMQ